MDPAQTMLACLSQRKLLLTAILDLTTQMERRCLQEDILLEPLLEKRQNFLIRLQKCADLSSHAFSELNAVQQEAFRCALQDEIPVPEALDGDAAETVTACREIKLRILALDQSVQILILSRQNELKEKLKAARKSSGTDTGFHF